MLRANGHAREADLFLQIREEATRRREANAIAAAQAQAQEQAVALFIRHMESLTGRRVNPAATLNEIIRAARESGGYEIAAWEAISLPAEDPARCRAPEAPVDVGDVTGGAVGRPRPGVSIDSRIPCSWLKVESGYSRWLRALEATGRGCTNSLRSSGWSK